MPITEKCPSCGIDFTPKDKRVKFCSSACSHKAKLQRVLNSVHKFRGKEPVPNTPVMPITPDKTLEKDDIVSTEGFEVVYMDDGTVYMCTSAPPTQENANAIYEFLFACGFTKDDCKVFHVGGKAPLDIWIVPKGSRKITIRGD
jgi:hypothetical protein